MPRSRAASTAVRTVLAVVPIDTSTTSASSIRYGTTGVGTGAQLASALTFKTAGIDATAVPFDGGAPNLTALLGNQVDVSTMQIGEESLKGRSGSSC